MVLSAVCGTYKPSFFTRLGLRYQNVVDKNALGLKDVAWNELLSEFVLGPLAVPEYVELAQEHNGTFLIQLDNFQDVVRVQYGLVTEKSGDPANILFMLDQDFFTKNNVETEASDVFKRLDVYIVRTEDSSEVASKTDYTPFWNQNLLSTDTRLSSSVQTRLSICYLALFELPEEALSDIKEEVLYKIRWYKELAEYEANKKPAISPPRVTVTVRETKTRPPFYLPYNEE